MPARRTRRRRARLTFGADYGVKISAAVLGMMSHISPVGSHSSCSPPVTRTRPSASRAPTWLARPAVMSPVGIHRLADGSNTSALDRVVGFQPPASSTRSAVRSLPLWRRGPGGRRAAPRRGPLAAPPAGPWRSRCSQPGRTRRRCGAGQGWKTHRRSRRPPARGHPPEVSRVCQLRAPRSCWPLARSSHSAGEFGADPAPAPRPAGPAHRQAGAGSQRR